MEVFTQLVILEYGLKRDVDDTHARFQYCYNELLLTGVKGKWS